MTISDVMPFFDLETMVIVYMSDGEQYTGVITGVENDFETDSGIDEIELYSGGSYSLGIEIPNITKITKAWDNGIGVDKMDEKDVMTESDYEAFSERLSMPFCPTELSPEELKELQD